MTSLQGPNQSKNWKLFGLQYPIVENWTLYYNFITTVPKQVRPFAKQSQAYQLKVS